MTKNGTCLRIVRQMENGGDWSAREVSAALTISQDIASAHLCYLEKIGKVEVVRVLQPSGGRGGRSGRGRKVYRHLGTEAVQLLAAKRRLEAAGYVVRKPGDGAEPLPIRVRSL